MKRIRWLYKLGVMFFPERCPYCGIPVEAEEIACKECINELIAKHQVIKSGTGGFRCISSFVYGGKIRRIILRIKYKSFTQYIAQLAEILAIDIRMIYCSYSFDIITAVPMHPEKIKRTKKQHNLKYTERKTNLSGAFKVKNAEEIKGKRILMIDDIITSGNTLSFCCKTLNRAKPSLICCATLATAQENYPPETII